MKQFPLKATWRNSGYDKPITLVGVYGEINGVVYYIAESKVGIPADQIVWPKETLVDKVRKWFTI